MTAAPHPDGGLGLQVVRSLRRYATETELYVATVGRDRHMHRTDLSALALVMDWGLAGETATPGRLSSALGLSAPATSALLDRLQQQGHVTRTPSPTDARSTVVAVTDHALEVGGAMFRRLAEHLGPVLEARSDAELRLVAAFLDDVVAAVVAARADVGDA